MTTHRNPSNKHSGYSSEYMRQIDSAIARRQITESDKKEVIKKMKYYQRKKYLNK